MAYMSRLFPKSNSSFLLQSGMALQSDVLRLTKDTFSLDSGLGKPKVCLKSELTRVPTNPKITRFTNKVGFLDMVTGEINVQKYMLERFFVKLMTGDAFTKGRAADRFVDLVGSCPDAVPGEPKLLLPMRFRQKLAGIELKKVHVMGFPVARVKGGYAIAVAGYVGFLPMRSALGIARLQGGSRFPVFGTDELNAYLSKYHLELSPELDALVGRHSRKPWSRFVNGDNQHLVSPEAIDFEKHKQRPFYLPHLKVSSVNRKIRTL